MPESDDRGIAVFTVVLAVLFLSSIALAVLDSVSNENLSVRYTEERLQSKAQVEYLLLSTLSRVSSLDPAHRWGIGDEKHQLEHEGTQFQVSLRPETGKVDLNTATTDTLSQFLVDLGIDQDQAAALADAIADWRDEDDLRRLNGAEANDYRAANRQHGPKNGAFETLSEVSEVLGIDEELALCAMPHLTLYSKQQSVDLRYASWSNAMSSSSSANDGKLAPTLAATPGFPFSVRISGTESPSKANLEAVVRLTGDRANAFEILDWRFGHSGKAMLKGLKDGSNLICRQQ